MKPSNADPFRWLLAVFGVLRYAPAWMWGMFRRRIRLRVFVVERIADEDFAVVGPRVSVNSRFISETDIDGSSDEFAVQNRAVDVVVNIAGRVFQKRVRVTDATTSIRFDIERQDEKVISVDARNSR